jgi:hypothetical protein
MKGAVASAISLQYWRTFAAKNNVPSYYVNYLAGVESKVLKLAKTCETGFFFITDPHVKYNHRMSGLLMAELIRRTGLNRVLCGGDFVEAFGEKYPSDKAAVDFAINTFTSLWVRPLREVGGRLYCAKGNHDFTVRHSLKEKDADRGFTYSGIEARKILVDRWTERDVETNPSDPSGCYYYADDAKAKVRYIVADTTDSEIPGNTAWGVQYGIHEIQLRWLIESAFGTVPEGYGIVVMHHIPVTTIVGAEGERKRYTGLRTILEQYQCRGKGTVDGVRYDFSNARGEILLDLTGHFHAERQTFQNGILHVTEPCDAAYMDYVYGSAPWCGELPAKKRGTVFEQTFGIVQIDRVRKIVHITRVGGGQDRAIHLLPRRLEVGGSFRFSPCCLNGASKFGVYDCDKIKFKPNPASKYCKLIEYKNEFASVSPEGTVRGCKEGVAMVVAMNDFLEKEILPVVIHV